jgi:alpha-glucosidase
MTRPSPWWRDAVVYQVYLRSFADADGNGVGDLEGLRRRLDHLVDLGADGLWINPCYPSPQRDHGYDVADYRDIDPAYGDLAVFDALLAEAHARGLRLLMDLVPNHCSDQHPWFQAALASGPGSPERARFLFRDGTGPDGSAPPNSWQSVFGGSAWTRVTEADGRPGQWYLHLFDAGQPDFDWRNPEVGDLFEDVLRFWFDRGIDGFRIDVAHGLVKAHDLPDWTLPVSGGSHAEQGSPPPPMWDQPEVHDVYRRWRRVAESYVGRDLTFVGEVWVRDPTALARYLRPDELPQAFYFDLLTQPWLPDAVRESIDRGRAHIGSTGATITWTLANHDVHRAVTRYGRDQDLVRPDPKDPPGSTRRRMPVDLVQGRRSARAAALVVLALPGSTYLYQGEELGLPEVLDLPDEARQDPIFAGSGGADLGRDGSRVPLPWAADAPSFGFSLTEVAAPPWLPQPPWFADYALDRQQADEGSTYRLYQRAVALRPDLFGADAGDLEWLDVDGRDDVLAFRRRDAVCVAVFGSEPYRPPAAWGRLLLTSEPAEREGEIVGGAAGWLRG